MSKGVFITLEGPDGAGKSTHARLLAGWLRRSGYRVLLTREPGGTGAGGRLRRILLDVRSDGMEPFVELMLYEASRALLTTQVIRPALRAGKVALLDRFYDSTWVYQGWAGGIPRRLVEQLNRLATGGLTPDLTLLLDLPARRGLARVKRPNRFEAKSVVFHERVRRGYLFLARRHPRRFRVIRADHSIERVQREIREAVRRALR